LGCYNPIVHSPCSADMMRLLPSSRTSNDGCSARDSMGVLPVSGMDRHAACGMDWLSLAAEWTGLIKCGGDTSPASGIDRAH
jgi:hypothetical protein